MANSFTGKRCSGFRQLFAGLMLSIPLGAAASDLTTGFYVSIALGQGDSYYGLRTSFDSARRFDALQHSLDHYPNTEPGAAALDLRRHFGGGHELLLNGVRLGHDSRLYADDATSGRDADSKVDGMMIAAVAVGVGLVAVIANADSVKVCGGTGCPSPEDPPESPDTDD